MSLSLCVTTPLAAVERDKKLHFAAGAMIAAPTYFIAKELGSKRPELWAILAASLAGLIKEMIDRKQPLNKFDNADLAYTVAGGVVVSYSIKW